MPPRRSRQPLRPSRVVLVLLISVASGCAYALVSGGSVNLAKAQQIEEGIQSLRQLTFKTNVPIVVMTPDQAEQAMVTEIGREYTDEELKLDGAAGAMLGLYPRGIDLKAETLKLLKAQVAGFYNPHSQEMILVSGNSDIGFWGRTAEFMMQRDLVGETLLAHELTHALQDQHFGIQTALDKLKDDDDRELALKSVAEGDATLAGLGYVVGKMDDTTVNLLVAKLEEIPAQFAAQTKDAPEALSAPLIFQYTEGARFVAEAFHHGGWKAVDDLYRNPPQSSQQIIRPALYFVRPTLPARIELAGYQNLLPGWEKVDENTIGELILRVMIERTVGKSTPEVGLAQRWAGDRMVTLRKGDSLAVIWMLLFADPAAAQRFSAAYAIALDRLLPAGTPHRVELQSKAVLTIVGQDAAALPASVWKATKITIPPTPPPPPIRATAPVPGRELSREKRA